MGNNYSGHPVALITIFPVALDALPILPSTILNSSPAETLPTHMTRDINPYRWRAWLNRFRALRNIPPLLRIVWSSSPGIVVALFALRLTSGIVPLAMLAVGKRIIDSVVLQVSVHAPPSRQLWALIAVEFALAALTSALGRAVDFCDALVADRFTLHVSVRIMEHTSRLDLACYEDPSFHDKLERARVQATDRIGTIQAVGRLLQETIVAVTLACGVLVYSPLCVLILFAAIVPAFVSDSYFAFRGYLLAFRQTSLRRELDYVRLVGGSKETAKELKIYGLSAYWTSLYKNLSRRLHRQNISLTKRRLLLGIMISILTSGGHYTAYGFVIYQTLSGKFSVGSLTFLAGAIAGASGRIQSIFAILSGVADQALFLRDLFDIFAVQPTVCSKSNPVTLPTPIKHGIEFRNVSFSYPGTSIPVLRNLSFSIKTNERLALVGSNGGGKTTVVKLLTRLYDPTAGEILLDGIDLRDYELLDLHRRFAVIFQDFVRYERTVQQNISIGNIESSHKSEMVKAAAEKSSAHSFITALPLGYQQMLGRRFEGGVDLSGGEWQRLALARAYCRNSPLLILDEPTASLDPVAERELLEKFADLTADRMALFISHRFSTVRMADRILVLEGGTIVEEGSHYQLIARGSRYSEMFEMQASNYR